MCTHTGLLDSHIVVCVCVFQPLSRETHWKKSTIKSSRSSRSSLDHISGYYPRRNYEVLRRNIHSPFSFYLLFVIFSVFFFLLNNLTPRSRFSPAPISVHSDTRVCVPQRRMRRPLYRLCRERGRGHAKPNIH